MVLVWFGGNPHHPERLALLPNDSLIVILNSTPRHPELDSGSLSIALVLLKHADSGSGSGMAKGYGQNSEDVTQPEDSEREKEARNGKKCFQLFKTLILAEISNIL